MNSRKMPTCAMLVALASLLAPVAAFGAPSLGLQGFLQSSAGVPAPDGDYGLTVRIYAGAKDVDPLYLDAIPGAAVKNGLFSVQLGVLKPVDLNIFTGEKAGWIGVQVGGEPELARVPLGLVPYSVHADTADLLACTGCVGVAQLDPAVLAPYATKASLAKVSTSGNYSDLSGYPDLSIFVQKTQLANVATTGNYADLINYPDLSVFAQKAGLAKVATSGQASDLTGLLPANALPAGVALTGSDNVFAANNKFQNVTVAGSFRVGTDNSACSAGNAGALRFANGIFWGCTGTAWVELNSPHQMVAYWPLDEGQGVDLNDPLNAANKGSSVGANWQANNCKFGGCLQFAGNVNSYALLPVAPFQNLGDFTLSFWQRQVASNTQPFTFSLAVPGNDNYLLLNAVSDAGWVHIVLRRIGGTTHVYKNGVLTDSIIYAAPGNVLAVTGGQVMLAQDQDCVGGCLDGTQSWSGVLDEIKVFNYSLGDGEIAAGLP